MQNMSSDQSKTRKKANPDKLTKPKLTWLKDANEHLILNEHCFV